MARAFPCDDHSLCDANYNAMVSNQNGAAMSHRLNFVLCPMCANSMSDERILPCSHSICGPCLKSRLWSLVLVCPVCRYEHNHDQILVVNNQSNRSQMEKLLADLMHPPNGDLGPLDSRRGFSGDLRNTSPPCPTPISSPSLPLSNGTSSNYKRPDINPASGAIPRTRNHYVQPIGNLMLGNNLGERQDRQITGPGGLLNDYLNQNENAVDKVKMPPLSPIVGGETRNFRMPSTYRQSEAAALPKEENADKEVKTDIPCCYHGPSLVEYYCLMCKFAFCNECTPNHKNHRFSPFEELDDILKIHLHDMLKEAQSREKDIENGFNKAKAVLDNIEINSLIAEREVAAASTRIMESLEERKNKLLENIRRVRSSKSEIIKKQMNTLKNTKYHLYLMQRGLLSNVDSKDTRELVNTHVTVSKNLKKMEHIALQLNPHEDSTISFNVKLKEVCDVVDKFGHIHSMAKASISKMFGVSMEVALLNTPSYIFVRCFDHLGERRISGGDYVQASLTYPSGKSVSLPIKDYDNGEYSAMYISNERGEHTIYVTIRGLPIFNAIQKPIVKHRRPYKEIRYPPSDTFGKGPNDQTSLSRGWGIHCDKDGSIYVTERDIHCVLIFGPDLKFIRKFGRFGDRDGELNRPAGITVDINRRIIVVDKDNHRIQVFNIEGQFLMRFGRRGSGNGEFQYPWDVDTNSKSQILVSDSRNHRVQLFDKDGNLLVCTDDTLGKCNFKLLEIPRGVCFDLQGNVLVVDFNNHHVLVLSPQLHLLSSIGRYGEGEGQFFRPQGIIVDPKGYIFIVESKNNRAQIFTPHRKFLGKVASSDKTKPFAPCDITMSPDGYLYIVDIDIGCVYKL